MIGDVCTKPVVTVSLEATIHEAAHRMWTQKVGALVAVDEAEKPVGIVTDRDIVVKVVAAGKDPAKVQPDAVMKTTLRILETEAALDRPPAAG